MHDDHDVTQFNRFYEAFSDFIDLDVFKYVCPTLTLDSYVSQKRDNNRLFMNENIALVCDRRSAVRRVCQLASRLPATAALVFHIFSRVWQDVPFHRIL